MLLSSERCWHRHQKLSPAAHLSGMFWMESRPPPCFCQTKDSVFHVDWWVVLINTIQITTHEGQTQAVPDLQHEQIGGNVLSLLLLLSPPPQRCSLHLSFCLLHLCKRREETETTTPQTHYLAQWPRLPENWGHEYFVESSHFPIYTSTSSGIITTPPWILTYNLHNTELSATMM